MVRDISIKEKAQGIKLQKIKTSSLIYRFQRMISLAISLVLVKFFPRISANQVSIAAIGLVLVSIFMGALIGRFDPTLVAIVQLFILFFSSVLDKVDGEMARLKEEFTQSGIYYDVLYHLCFPLAMYFVVGFYFYGLLSSPVVLFSTVILGILVTAYRLSGKLRHHVRFKIILENHQSVIKDLGRLRFFRNQMILARFLRYVVFMTYDWVWAWFVVLIAFSFYYPVGGSVAYFVYILVALVLLIVELLWRYPEESLFTREDLNLDPPR